MHDLSFPNHGASTATEEPAQVSIPELNPAVPPPHTSHLQAVVTLVWPYSSTTQSTALLLAEPDIWLRRHRGQVRVRFLGRAARCVGASGVGIGDRVQLLLEGSSWILNETSVLTPGRSVEGELSFNRRLSLKVRTFDLFTK